MRFPGDTPGPLSRTAGPGAPPEPGAPIAPPVLAGMPVRGIQLKVLNIAAFAVMCSTGRASGTMTT